MKKVKAVRCWIFFVKKYSKCENFRLRGKRFRSWVFTLVGRHVVKDGKKNVKVTIAIAEGKLKFEKKMKIF
jgi:hypothetical protein